jgi:cysteine desulfurase / selenocysteine lyase
MVYLDNAATSFPKPEQTLAFLSNFVRNIGGNPGRSGHTLSLEAARVIFNAREKLTRFINGASSGRLIFAQNGTEGLNLAILGLVGEKDHVVTTSMEHNSVARPLTFLQKERGVEVTIVPCREDGTLNVDRLHAALTCRTRAVIVNHGSNVVGAVQPIGAIRQAIGDTILIVDACQTIGSVPIDLALDNIDILCFSCHKSLYAIQGLGALYIREGIEPTPLKFGGTGSKSESLEQPDVLPDRYECGTPNTPGIASLLGGLAFIEEAGMEKITARKKALRTLIIDGLARVPGVTLYGIVEGESLPVIAFNLKGRMPSEVGYELNRAEIFVRVGLQCSPLAHQTIGTFPGGTVRVSPGYFTSDNDVGRFLEAVRKIAGR